MMRKKLDPTGRPAIYELSSRKVFEARHVVFGAEKPATRNIECGPQSGDVLFKFQGDEEVPKEIVDALKRYLGVDHEPSWYPQWLG